MTAIHSFALAALAGQHGEEGSWSYTVEPLLWVAGVDGDASADDEPSNPIDLFGDLDSGFLLALEASPPVEGPSLLADGLYVRLVDDDGALHSRTEAWMVEAGVAWELVPQGPIEGTVGFRYVSLEYEAGLGSGSLGRAQDEWIDPWVGARTAFDLGRSWSANLRGDVGGFGVGSDFTWQALATFEKRLGSRVRIDLGYRAIALDFEDTDLEYDAIVHGPIVGLAIGL